MEREKDWEPDYYLNNFMKLTDFVEDVYGDQLKAEEVDFLSRFKGLPKLSRLLFIRLISRKGPLFRLDKLHYKEIPSLPKAALVLAEEGFLALNEPWQTDQLLPLFTKPELIALFSRMVNLKSSMKKEGILTTLLTSENPEEIRNRLSSFTDIISPLHSEEIQTFRILFFGNLHQDLSEFVITDLEVVTYESYLIDRQNRLFKNRDSLEKALAYHRIGEEYYEKQETGLKAEELITLAEGLPEPGEEYFLIRRRDRLLNHMARQMERLNRFQEALGFYALSSHTPSRERRVRILFNSERYEDCESLLNEILLDSLDEEEREFALFFTSKLYKKLRKKTTKREALPIREMTITCPHLPERSVEQSALMYYESRGYRGYYSENSIWNSLFGLAFWDIIFHPLPGTFFNPFQRGPVDLTHPEFRKRRESLIAYRFKQLAVDEEWQTLLLNRFDKSQGISNIFINWKQVDREMVKNVLEAVPRDHLLAIFERISRDVRGNTSGFPDLLLFPPPETESPFSYLLAEVKGPGDKLQKNQKRWISLFEEKEIPFMLVLLKWENK